VRAEGSVHFLGSGMGADKVHRSFASLRMTKGNECLPRRMLLTVVTSVTTLSLPDPTKRD
jgi:hypothetical protein